MKIIGVICAFMFILGLKVAMIDSFSNNDENFRFLMNYLTSVGIFIITFVISFL